MEPGESGLWPEPPVPWARVHIEPDAEITTGQMPLVGDVSTYGDIVMATLVELPSEPQDREDGPQAAE